MFVLTLVTVCVFLQASTISTMRALKTPHIMSMVQGLTTPLRLLHVFTEFNNSNNLILRHTYHKHLSDT
jgi:hypothetical protein